MKKLIAAKNTKMKAATSLSLIMLLSACQLTATESLVSENDGIVSELSISSNASTVTMTDNEQSTYISVSGKNENKVYRVNGKAFTWNDLTDEQKARLGKLEEKIAKAEKTIQIDEEKLEKIEALLEVKEEALEEQAAKLEEAAERIASVTLESKPMKEAMKELEEKALVLEKQAMAFEKEAQLLEKEYSLVELEEIEKVEAVARELEKLLIEIAATK